MRNLCITAAARFVNADAPAVSTPDEKQRPTFSYAVADDQEEWCVVRGKKITM
jgi:hypothetical protein